ncbi:ABC transporter ATP-binding protein [Paenibacillus senegalensis]|uniref:ABC transporter ATP-binding protein n=1 Tax=Paenibacillus senegalensis TaxID=1465766 RepID=UPI000287F65E|nr:ATP-binding cassette domain-containing protein [Paenibacillus senegalensis]
MLEVKNVSKVFQNQRGVEDISFSIARGEIVGFLGPNGAGKTTTMRMITGYLNPSQGTIEVDGLSMNDQPAKARKKIGYLPEIPPLYPEMTVESYLKFVADLREVPRKKQAERLEAVIYKLGLSGREKQIIRSLSKGYKQRLGLAQAIIHEPDLLVLDEPTSGLDPNQIIEIRQLIQELGENHTVLLSTHILPEVNTICNRVLIINQGRIVLDEKPERLAESMEQTFKVHLQVKGIKAQVVQEIRQMEEVAEVELRADSTVRPEESETVSLLISAKEKKDIREALFYKMAASGFPILEMKRDGMTLEDIFVKLTTDEEAAELGEAPIPATDAAIKGASSPQEQEGQDHE